MAYTAGQYHLTDLLQDVYEDLGELNTALATGGTTSTIIDTVQIGQHSDDDWKEGVAFITWDAGDASAAPQGEFQRISGYVDSTGTFTADTVFTVTPAVGDTYAWASDYFPIRNMIELANAGLRKLGDIVRIDTTTLDSVSNQTEYAYDELWKRNPPLYVDVQGLTGNANNNRWVRIHNPEVIPADPGTDGLLILPQIVNSRDIRVCYIAAHPRLTDFDDIVSEYIHPDLAFAAVLERALSWQNMRLKGTDRFLLQKFNDAKQELNIASARHPIWRPQKRMKLNLIEGHWHDVGEPDKVRLSSHRHHHHH